MADTLDQLIQALQSSSDELRRIACNSRGALADKAEKQRLEGELLQTCAEISAELEKLTDDQATLLKLLGGSSRERFMHLMKAMAMSAGASQTVSEDARLQRLSDLLLTCGELLRKDFEVLASRSDSDPRADGSEEQVNGEVEEEESQRIEAEEPNEDVVYADGDRVAESALLGIEHEMRLNIVSQEDIKGVTWYNLRLQEGTETRFFAKTYENFKEFHMTLEKRANPCIILGEFPYIGMFNVGYVLQLPDWKKEQRKKLERYLRNLLCQLPSTNANLDVAAFIGRLSKDGTVIYGEDENSESV